MAADLLDLADQEDAAASKSGFMVAELKAVYNIKRTRLSEAKLLRRIIHHRQMRNRFFENDLFADPAWDILLDLLAAQHEEKRVSVTSLCIAAGVPPTTALRWVGQLTDYGFLLRSEDPIDRRRSYLELTEKASSAMNSYFSAIGEGCELLV